MAVKILPSHVLVITTIRAHRPRSAFTHLYKLMPPLPPLNNKIILEYVWMCIKYRDVVMP